MPQKIARIILEEKYYRPNDEDNSRYHAVVVKLEPPGIFQTPYIRVSTAFDDSWGHTETMVFAANIKALSEKGGTLTPNPIQGFTSPIEFLKMIGYLVLDGFAIG